MAMTPPPAITEAQWPTYQPFIEREYLTFNRSARVVAKKLETHFHVTTSVRRLKLKFDAWKWDKKISAVNYAAMNRVIQDVGQQVVFIVPKMGGRCLWRVEGKKIVKETGRKRTNNERNGKPPPLTFDLETAHKVLQEVGITFELRRPAHTQARLAANRSQISASWPTTSARPTQDLTEQPDKDDDDDDDDDDDSSTVSDESTPDADMVQESSRELNSQNFPSELRLRQHHESSRSVLPFAAAFLADLHCNIFPSIPEYKLVSPSTTIAYHHGGNAGVVLNSESLPNDYSPDLGFNYNSELPSPQRIFREKLIEQTLIEYYQCYDHNSHKKLALEFSAYYIAQVLAGQEILDDYNHVDRKDARTKLQVMLEHNNMQLLSHCYWVSSLMISYDKIRQMLAFLEDCIDCIETSTSYMGRVLRPWIRLMVLKHRYEFSHYDAQSPRLSQAVLEQMNRNFDASQDLLESMDYLSQHGHEGSHAHLILRLYYAWNLCHREDPNGGLIKLIACLPLAESMFGTEHLVAINCMSMVAKAYAKLSNPIMAKFYVDIALTRLMSCSRMLMSRYYQLQLSSAELLLADGKSLEAREKVEHVLHYRRQHLGVQAPMTWDAAKMLFNIMSRQGFGLEAQQREAELRARYAEEWSRHPITVIPRQTH